MDDSLPLLCEIGLEELPPKALNALSDAFTTGIVQRLQDIGLPVARATSYASPRRLAVLLENLPAQSPDTWLERRGPAVSSAFDATGAPTRAALGFARSCGVEFTDLAHAHGERGEYLVFRERRPGQPLETLLPSLLSATLAALPAPKRMRWGSGTVEFVRPVHWLVLLHGERVVDCEIMGLRSGRWTRGHRFLAPQALAIAHAQDYAHVLETEGMVQPDATRRRAVIETQILQSAAQAGGRALIDPALLEEVTALVEWPVALTGSFEARFLEVPQEALISTMQDHQKYFPLVDAAGRLLPRFVVISNLLSRRPDTVRDGNERVLRPRFADAEFFWNQDRQQPLAQREAGLAQVVFERRLGSLADKARRLEQLMDYLAPLFPLEVGPAHRAARLAKCDLLTRMVFEFPELQGTMGRYYALHDGEDPAVATALEQHYWPRQAGAALPGSALAQALALADRIDTLVGIFAIGKEPTGARDPFALRRAALGVLRILIERQRPLALRPLLQASSETLREKVPDVATALPRLRTYLLERLRGYLLEQGIAAEVFEAVAALDPDEPLDFVARAHAVQAFRARPEAASLAAANKRIGNLLRKADTTVLPPPPEATPAATIPGLADNADPHPLQPGLLIEPAERQLYQALLDCEPRVAQAMKSRDYVQALTALAALRAPVDAFFSDVLVMTPDPVLREHRLRLLARLAERLSTVADIGRLATG